MVFNGLWLRGKKPKRFCVLNFLVRFSGGARIIVKYGQKNIANVYRVYIRNCQVNNKKI